MVSLALLMVSLAFGQVAPPSALGGALPSGAARVVSLTGQVSILRDGGELWAIHLNEVVMAGREIQTGPDGHALLQIQDGSTFEVFPNSRVVFRENRFDLRNLLDVFLGKVKVHIQKFGGRPNPYRIHSPTALIAVRGTTFEVEVPNSEETTVTVVEGLVDVENKIKPGRVISLRDGEVLRVSAAEPLAKVGPARMRTLARVAEQVADQLLDVLRNRPGGVGNAPGGASGGSVPTTAGGGPTVGGGTSGTGTGTPPTGGRPGGPGNGDTNPGVPIPPTTGGGTTGGTGTGTTTPTPTIPRPPDPRGGNN